MRAINWTSQIRRVKWPSLPFIFLISSPLLLPKFLMRLHYDNYLYQSIALDIVRYGRHLYLDTWDQNFPGIVFIHSLAILLFGSSEFGLKLFDVLVQIGFIVIFYRVLNRWLSKETSAIATLLYVFYYIAGYYPLSMQRDVYGTIAIVISFYVLVRQNNVGARRYFALIHSGLWMGVSIAIRPTSVVFLLLFVLYLVEQEWREMRKVSFRSVVFVLVSILPMGLFLLWYSFLPGGLKAFYYSTIRFNVDIYTKITYGWREATKELFYPLLLLPLGILGMSLCAFDKKQLGGYLARLPQIAERRLFMLLPIGALVTVIVQQKYFRYHFAPFFILLIPFAALGIKTLSMYIQEHRLRAMLLVLMILLSSRIGYVAPGICVARLISNPVDDAAPIRDYLNQHLQPSDEIEICSLDPRYRCQLDRKCVGPYPILHSIGLRTKPGVFAADDFTDYQRKWQISYLQLLRAQHPKILLIDTLSDVQKLVSVYKTTLHFIPGFDSWLQSEYREDTIISGVLIYRSR